MLEWYLMVMIGKLFVKFFVDELSDVLYYSFHKNKQNVEGQSRFINLFVH